MHIFLKNVYMFNLVLKSRCWHYNYANFVGGGGEKNCFYSGTALVHFLTILEKFSRKNNPESIIVSHCNNVVFLFWKSNIHVPTLLSIMDFTCLIRDWLFLLHKRALSQISKLFFNKDQIISNGKENILQTG